MFSHVSTIVSSSRVLMLRSTAGRCAAVAMVCLWAAAPLAGQATGVHYMHHGATPPGAIGRWQLQRCGPLSGYFQPVEIKAPAGALISLAVEGRFEQPAPGPVLAGMLIGSVYRLRVTGIPLHEGAELFPTVEIIDRLYPPHGKAWHFPIQLELTQQDLELALAGRFVTRVVYLEEPESAVPVAEADGQLSLDVRPGESPLEVADGYGRPMALVRLGGRLPTNPSQPDFGFLYGSPPVTKIFWPTPIAPLVPQVGPPPGSVPPPAALPSPPGAPMAYREAFTPPATYWERNWR